MPKAIEGLVAWGERVDHGSLDTVWVCPTDGLNAVETMIEAGHEVTDENLIEHAGGRWRRLTWITFGDGEVGVAEVVDSETGQALTNPSDSVRFTLNRDGEPRLAAIGNVPLEGGRILRWVKGSQSKIVSPSDPHPSGFVQAPPAIMEIDSLAKKLDTRAKGEVNILSDTRAIIALKEENGSPTAELALSLQDHDSDTSLGQVNFQLDGEGKLTDVWAYGEAMLRHLEIRTRLDHPDDIQRASIVTGANQRTIFQTVMKELGYPGAERLDLRLTTAGLWAAMGQRRNDPARMLAFR